MIICMHQIAIRVNKYQLRESQRYMTFQSRFSIFCSIALSVSVTELPRTPMLRTFGPITFVYQRNFSPSVEPQCLLQYIL